MYLVARDVQQRDADTSGILLLHTHRLLGRHTNPGVQVQFDIPSMRTVATKRGSREYTRIMYSCRERRSSRLQRLLDIRNEVLHLLDTDRQPHEVVPNAEQLALRLGDAAVRHLRGVLCKTLDAAKRLRKREQARGGQERVSLLHAAADAERDHAAEGEAIGVGMRGDVRVDVAACVGRERAVGEVVARVRREAGVDDLGDVRRGLEGARDGERVRAVGLHAQVQRLCAALREPAVVRARHGADRIL